MKIYRANVAFNEGNDVFWHTNKRDAWRETKESRDYARELECDNWKTRNSYGMYYVQCYDFPTTKKELVEFLNSRDIFKTDNG